LYGDPLPRGAVVRFGTQRFRLENSLAGLAFSPDGRYILAPSGEGNAIGIWKVDSGTELLRLRAREADSRSAALSPDGRFVAIGTCHHLVHIWDLQAKKELRTLRGHTKEVNAVAFAPDGKALASASWDATVRLWDLATGQVLHQLIHTEAGMLSGVVYSPDGLRLASKDNRNVWVWEVATGKLLWHVGCDQGSREGAIAYSRRGNLLLACAVDGSVRAWNVQTGAERFRLLGHRGPVHTLAVSPDGKTVASGGEDGTIRLWAILSRKEIGCIDNHDDDVALAFSPDGKWLAARGNAIRLWDTATLKERDPWPGHFGNVCSLTFSPNGRILVSSAETVRFWDVATGKQVRWLPPPSGQWYSCVAFSPDGKLVAYTAPPSTVRLIDATTDRLLSELAVNGGGIDSIAFSPDGATLATTSRDAKLRLWNLKTGKEVRRWDEKPSGSDYLSFSPDGRLLATVWKCKTRFENEIHVLDVATGEERFHRLQPTDDSTRGRISRVQFLPGTRSLLTVGRDDFVVSRWAVTGEPQGRRELRGPQPYRLTDAAVSPDGKLLAAGRDHGGTVTLWELATGEPIECFRGHRGYLRRLRFSPDGLMLASAAEDTTMLLWDITGRIDKRYTPRSPLGPSELDGLWEKLSAPRAGEAYRAAWTLASVPDQAVPFLTERLRPVSAVSTEQLQQLLTDIDSDSFETREKASRTLVSSGDVVAQQLRQALTRSKLSTEGKKRLRDVLIAIESDSYRLRLQRAITTLEYMNHPSALTLLKRLAQGTSAAQLTLEAKAAVERSTKRSVGRP
jgi:WD40 repeat protein